jgi:hypothetical protein
MDMDTRLAYHMEWKHMMEERQRQAREKETTEQLMEAKERAREAEARERKAACGLLADGVPPEVVARNFGISLADVLKLATASQSRVRLWKRQTATSPTSCMRF